MPEVFPDFATGGALWFEVSKRVGPTLERKKERKKGTNRERKRDRATVCTEMKL